ncbi:peroxiredoxin-like family protein [Paraglaciecola aquimarina]|uniref:thioredoxin-dependent peroxiredoxin n=1 Tax=Paraglaciecola aquimarina TaxID=1235557 RepID=A0ABU3T1W5_9ALTE|nr:peroxiredoxin-like family protein [Paraglaciecola aquimarina]MDU0356187.1 peroxiredoxin-like family protein [Paraglaciecola aquimarina]
MTSLKQQTEAKIAETRQGNPTFMQNVDELILQSKAFEHGADAIAVGKQVPRFCLPNQTKELISLQQLLANGPVVLTFYRGSWCPYCNLQLRALQATLAEIHALGAELVAISPEVPDDSLSKREIHDLGFEVLSDQSASIAQQYGVAWQVPEVLLEHMRVDRKLDLNAINNGNGNILPIPATFVINQDGIVTWRYVDVDYRTRSEPSDVVEALRSLFK